jgi:PIN domain nuclease of toxin-antitoxin system
MNCLLDTHTFLWAAMYPEKLSCQARVTSLMQ